MAWTSGSTVYDAVYKDESRYAVPRGKSLNDSAFVYKIQIDSRSQKEYFVNCETHERRWKLPQLVPASNLSYRERMIALYNVYQPDKISNVDVALASYAGREDEMMQKLVTKYGPEPPAPMVVSDECTTEEYEQRVYSIFRYYRPTKLDSVPDLLEKWKTQEKQLLATLVSKYGPEPLPGGEEEVKSEPLMQQKVTPDATTGTESYRARILAIYERFAPNKVGQVDNHLAKYRGNEESFIESLIRKYDPGSVGAESSTNAPTKNSPLSMEARVRRFYAHYKPGKPQLADQALQRYHGQEEVLLETLIAKYGPEPTVEENQVTTPVQRTDEDAALTSPASPLPAPPASAEESHDAGEPAPPTGKNKKDDTTPEEATGPVVAEDEKQQSDTTMDESRFSQHSPPSQSAKQQMLLSFLNDREVRLREALERHDKTVSMISNLQEKNAALSEELDRTIQAAEQAKLEMLQQTAKTHEHMEDSARLWSLEKEHLMTQAKVAAVAAKRVLNETKLQYEEHIDRKEAEIAELRRRVAEANNDIKEVTERSAELLKYIEERQKESDMLRNELSILQERVKPRPTTEKHTQTELLLLLQNEISLNTNSQTAVNPLACGRCNAVARITCNTCKLALCTRCDNVLHSANPRFAAHKRQKLLTQSKTPREKVFDALRSCSSVAPVDTEDVEAEFDAAVSEYEAQREHIANYQQTVAQMEERIAQLRNELSALTQSGTKPPKQDPSWERRQIEELCAANKLLQCRIDELELKLAAQPEISVSETADREISELRAKLSASLAQSKEYRAELKMLRGRLQMLMSTPYGLRAM